MILQSEHVFDNGNEILDYFTYLGSVVIFGGISSHEVFHWILKAIGFMDSLKDRALPIAMPSVLLYSCKT